MKDSILTDTEKQAIKKAVENAEKQTSGEIVPYIVKQSGTYPETMFKGGIILTLITILVLVWMTLTWSLGVALSPVIILALVVIAFLLGYYLTYFISFLRYSLVTRNRKNERVKLRAMNAFLQEEIFNTRDRTGILIFISLFEQRVEIVGDTAIRKAIPDTQWLEVANTIIAAIKKRQMANGIIEAIGICGTMLEQAGVKIKDDDTNELKNDIRIEN